MKKYLLLTFSFVTIGFSSCVKDGVPIITANKFWGLDYNYQHLIGGLPGSGMGANVIVSTDIGIDWYCYHDKQKFGTGYLQYVNSGNAIDPNLDVPYVTGTQDFPFTYYYVGKDNQKREIWHYDFAPGVLRITEPNRNMDIGMLSGDYICEKVEIGSDKGFTLTYMGPRSDVIVSWTRLKLDDKGILKTSGPQGHYAAGDSIYTSVGNIPVVHHVDSANEISTK